MRLITLCWLEVHGCKLQGSPLHFEYPSPFSHQSKSSQWRQRQTESCLSRIPIPTPAVPGTQRGAKQVDAEPKGDDGRRMKEGSRAVWCQTPGAHTHIRPGSARKQAGGPIGQEGARAGPGQLLTAPESRWAAAGKSQGDGQMPCSSPPCTGPPPAGCLGLSWNWSLSGIGFCSRCPVLSAAEPTSHTRILHMLSKGFVLL